MPDPIGPGIYPDMDSAVYFADPCEAPSLSQSFAKILLAQSPRHAWMKHPRLNPRWRSDEGKYEKARAIGNAAHRLVIGRGKALAIITAENFQTKAAQAERDAAVASGKSPILAKHYRIAEDIRDAARPQLDLCGCKEAFVAGRGEVVMIAYDEEHGIWLRSMADWVVSGALLYDLKTGETSAAPHAIPNRMVSQGWDVQAAMQERILDILDPDNRGRRQFRFVAIEDDEPYALSVNELPESVMEFGRRKLRRACETWAECVHQDVWPAYPPLVHWPEYPGYEETKWLNREISDAAHSRMPQPLDPDLVFAG
jgi:hypothetical protein